MRHLLPPHRSTRSFEFELPTAVQVLVAGHATADSLLEGDRAGLGVRWMCQLLPFHPSARAVCAPDLLAVTPTASQADGDEQATPFKALHAAPGGLGTGWMRHLLPSHRSVSATPAPELRT